MGINLKILLPSDLNSKRVNPVKENVISFDSPIADSAPLHFDEVGNDDAKDVINSSIGNQYDGIIEGSLLFSPDSKHLVYGVSNSDGQFVVVDGKDGKRYDSIIFIYDGGGIMFDSPDRFHYLARKNGGIYLVEEIAATYI